MVCVCRAEINMGLILSFGSTERILYLGSQLYTTAHAAEFVCYLQLVDRT
jgi:hypothetical protein